MSTSEESIKKSMLPMESTCFIKIIVMWGLCRYEKSDL